jgi:proteasome lid subunit RPN8/RPN11
MTISIRRSIRALVAPHHNLACSKRLWERVRQELARRGNGERESGAFLLGTIDRAGRREIQDFVPYDDLDPACLDTGIIEFRGAVGCGKLYALCRERGLDVVADVHTHPGPPYQSKLDRDNPMMAREGHIAIILPHFAQTAVGQTQLGLYRYQGNYRWEDWCGREARRRFHIGF